MRKEFVIEPSALIIAGIAVLAIIVILLSWKTRNDIRDDRELIACQETSKQRLATLTECAKINGQIAQEVQALHSLMTSPIKKPAPVVKKRHHGK